jgi:hypothetical protein
MTGFSVADAARAHGFAWPRDLVRREKPRAGVVDVHARVEELLLGPPGGRRNALPCETITSAVSWRDRSGTLTSASGTGLAANSATGPFVISPRPSSIGPHSVCTVVFGVKIAPRRQGSAVE